MAKISASKARRRHRRVDPDNVKPPRPLNKFSLFKKAFIADWADPKPENKVMVKAAGEAWKNLPPAEIAYWTRVQEEAAAEHARQFPDYRYQPAKRGEKAAARARARRTRAEDIYHWDTPSLCATSLESSPASTLSSLSQWPSEPSSPSPSSSRIEPEVWVPPTGGPNDEEYIYEGTLQPLPEFMIESFESQAPQPSTAKPQDDWTQYIDPDLLAMDESNDYHKGAFSADGFGDTRDDVRLHALGTATMLLPPPQMAYIDPSLLCPDGQ